MKREKSQEAKKKSTPEELEMKFRAKIEHEVTRILEWNAKLRKSLTSKMHKIGDMERENVKETITKTYNDTISAFEAKGPVEKPVFRL